MSAEAGLRLTDAQRFDWLRLWRSELIGPRTFRTLINRFGSARAALEALPRLAPSGKPVRIASLEEIEREFELAAACGAVFIALGEENYPALLRNIDTAPPVIAVRGTVSVFTRPAVAIVGSRNASGAGLAFAERLSRAGGLCHRLRSCPRHRHSRPSDGLRHRHDRSACRRPRQDLSRRTRRPTGTPDRRRRGDQRNAVRLGGAGQGLSTPQPDSSRVSRKAA